jgi:hypothetical protein
LLGALLAVYDGAEVVFKPIFGARRPDRRAAGDGRRAARLRAHVVGLGRRGNDRRAVGRAAGPGRRCGAFSPSASALVARLNPSARRGRAFGSYGFYKSIGYTLGRLLGGALVALGGLTCCSA